jgi:Glycosyltransferase like family 2
MTYTTYAQLLAAAEKRATNASTRPVDLPMLTMFCVALRRDVYDLVGPVDERFELALFEDDDYALRVKRAGYRVVYAEDVLVHHFGEASLGALFPTGRHATLFKTNRKRLEDKWGLRWRDHSRRQTREYGDTVARIREIARRSLPAGAKVLVISKGDDELLRLDGCTGEHFPQLTGGVYAGHHPADSKEAIAELETQRSGGAEFLLIPQTSLWWLDHYGEFREYLSHSCHEVVHRDDACVIYSLGQSS